MKISTVEFFPNYGMLVQHNTTMLLFVLGEIPSMWLAIWLHQLFISYSRAHYLLTSARMVALLSPYSWDV